MKRICGSVFMMTMGLVFISIALPAMAEPGVPESIDVFMSGTEGVNTYRIPGMLVAPDKSLLVFCEARKESNADASPTDIVLRRSVDEGRTWLPMEVLVRGEGSDAYMNPCPIVDQTSNTIFLFYINANTIRQDHHRHFLMASTDNGQTWSKPVEMADRIAKYDDSFVSGPGVGIQMRDGCLIIPGYTGAFDDDIQAGYYSCVLYSKDHGKTWTLGARVSQFSDESQAVERKDGSLMLNMRGDMGKSCRGVAISKNGGRTWSKFYWDRALNECPCQASIVRYGFTKQDGKDRLLFANPDNSGEKFGLVNRTKMTVRLSYDEGKTWPVKKCIHPGPSSYSCMVRLQNGDIGIIYEGGNTHRREWIRFTRFSLSWLTDGADTGK